MKMRLFEQRVDIFCEEHLTLDFTSEIVGDDPVITEADSLELKNPSCREPADNQDEKKTINQPYVERRVAQAKG